MTKREKGPAILDRAKRLQSKGLRWDQAHAAAVQLTNAAERAGLAVEQVESIVRWLAAQLDRPDLTDEEVRDLAAEAMNLAAAVEPPAPKLPPKPSPNAQPVPATRIVRASVVRAPEPAPAGWPTAEQLDQFFGRNRIEKALAYLATQPQAAGLAYGDRFHRACEIARRAR